MSLIAGIGGVRYDRRNNHGTARGRARNRLAMKGGGSVVRSCASRIETASLPLLIARHGAGWGTRDAAEYQRWAASDATHSCARGGPDPELAEARAEIARLSEALKEMGVRLMLAEGKERWG